MAILDYEITRYHKLISDVDNLKKGGNMKINEIFYSTMNAIGRSSKAEYDSTKKKVQVVAKKQEMLVSGKCKVMNAFLYS